MILINNKSFKTASLILVISMPLIGLSQPKSGLDRVEPPFWWAGMSNPELQLLVYGENIASLIPELSYEGVSIERVIRVENTNYLFIDLKVSPDVKSGNFIISFKDNKKVRQSYEYEIKERRDGSRERVGFTPEDVIYLITPDRFVNGDPDNDEFEAMPDKINRSDPFGRHGGDIQGMIDKLDYIYDMGFTGIWLNPVLENDMPEASYHGYATTDFYKIDARYGSNEKYLELSAKAKDKGIKLIMDMIVNHCGSEHWWMKDIPTSDWTNFNNTFSGTTHRKYVIQDPYRSDYDHKQMVDGWFVPTMPDMNQRNPLMSKYLIQNSIWWIEYADLSGVRQDTYPYADKDFLTRWSCEIMDEYPNFNITGEEWVGNPNILAYWQRGKDNHDGYISCLPSLLDFPIQESLWSGLNEPEGDWSGMINMYRMLANDHIYADPFNFVTFPDNHDMDRFFTAVKEDYIKFKNGLAYILTMRGIPQLYYGTELLFTNAEGGNHGLIRKEYPGGWEGDEVNAFTGAGLTDQQKDAREFISKIQNWRKSANAIHHGSIKHFVPSYGTYVYFRMAGNDIVMVIINRNSQDINLDLSRYEEVLQGKSSGTEIISGRNVTLDNTLNVPANDPMIIELK
jgi:glycosidase